MWADENRTGSWPLATPEWKQQIALKTMKAYRFGDVKADMQTRDGAVIKRTLRGTPMFDTNYFRLCDEEDPAKRFGLWNNDEALMLNILRPLTNNRREVNIRFIDFRKVGQGGVHASNQWCNIGVSAPLGKTGVCTLRYCYDFEEFYETGRQSLSPNDFAENCFKDYFYDMDGNAITDEEQYQEFGVFLRIRDNMLDEIINGTGVLDDGSAAKGIKKWFEDFAADHQEISDCSWIAPKYVTTQIACANVGKLLEDRIKQLRYADRDIRAQGTGATQDDFGENNFVLYLNERAAECVVKCHVCQTVCGNALSLQAMTPEQLREWKFLYPSYLNGGRFGQGYIVTPNGMTISIVRSRRLAETDMFFLFTGSASDPEAGLRISPYDWTPYVNYLRRNEKPNIPVNKTPYQSKVESLYGGVFFSYVKPDLCDDRFYRWNWKIVDRKPWMQAYWSNLDISACTEAAVTSIAASPDTPNGPAGNC